MQKDPSHQGKLRMTYNKLDYLVYKDYAGDRNADNHLLSI